MNKIKIPTNCPACNDTLIMEGEFLCCKNDLNCFPQICGKIQNWVSTLNILELGDTLIEKLVKTKKVKDIADLYSLSIKELSEVDRMGEKSATNVYNELWKNKTIDLDQLLGGLSIPMIGTNSIKLVIDSGITNLNDFYNADIATFEAVKGMGKVKAKCLYDGLIKNRDLIDRILRSGIELNAQLAKIVGKKIVLTGAMAYKRSYLEEVIRKGNGELKNSVTKDVDYLVTNDLNSGSTKFRAAKRLGIPILTEEEFLNLPDFNKILVFANE